MNLMSMSCEEITFTVHVQGSKMEYKLTSQIVDLIQS
jgi:hypothetical protein